MFSASHRATVLSGLEFALELRSVFLGGQRFKQACRSDEGNPSFEPLEEDGVVSGNFEFIRSLFHRISV